jgi:hypothetical protein
MRDRTHEECASCPWGNVEPPLCSGHVAGPSACQERPDKEAFEKPAEFLTLCQKNGAAPSEATWRERALAAEKKIERLRGVLGFARGALAFYDDGKQNYAWEGVKAIEAELGMTQETKGTPEKKC